MNDNWGLWHEGNKFDARVYHDGIDHYPDNFDCRVEIRERDTGKVHTRHGKGKFIGNFSPIWVWWHGQSIQLTELLRLQ